MLCAVFWTLRLAYADHLAQSDSPKQLRKALHIARGNAGYWLHLADALEADGDSGTADIQRAAQADPYNANIWIRAGLDAELNGNYPEAERDLLRAAALSRQYGPRWALVNYYYRRGDAERFWPWAKSALELSYGDRKLLFDLCWNMQPVGEAVLRRGIPDKPKILREYLGFLLETQRPEAALAVARRLEEQASNDDRDLLLWYANVMLGQRRWQAALSTWNALCLRKLVHYAPLDAGQGRLLTNGDFKSEPMDSGFDWHIPQVRGVSAAHSENPSWLRFNLDGTQPENCWLVYQFVPVVARQRYALRFRYRTENIAAETGLQWKLIDPDTGTEIPLEAVSLSSNEWTNAALKFTAPAEIQNAQVALVYQRHPGTVRIEGTVWLKNVGLEWLR
jgi:tetratricopeptide (TPR) repeat protein